MTEWKQKLCGVYEIVQLTGVSKGRVSQYTNARWFPKPLDHLGMGRVWDYKQVVAAWEKHKIGLERHRPPTSFAAEPDRETP